ncbi:MAG: AsmA-like C-terminal region-containing protein [Bacteroidales bacterium]|nr:AsmA-like C-terminal region-containing protein [Bacteroidales bacterium]
MGKVILAIIGALTILFVISLAVFVHYIYTNDVLTPIARNKAGTYLNCQTEIGNVRLTLFSTFPRLGVKAERLLLLNPMEHAPTDTLASIEKLVGFVDLKTFLASGELMLSDFLIKNAHINVFIDENGVGNFDVLNADAFTGADSEASFLPERLELGPLIIQNVNISYHDKKFRLNTSLKESYGVISGIWHEDIVFGHIDFSRASLFLEYDQEVYVPVSDIRFELPARFDLSGNKLHVSQGRLGIDGMGFGVNGFLQPDPVDGRLTMSIDYHTEEAVAIAPLLKFLPPSQLVYLEGIEADGMLSSSGTISGFPEDSFLPYLMLNLDVSQGTLSYTGFPLPFHDVTGDFRLFTDLTDDGTSYLVIDRLKARTKQSSFSTKGTLDQLLSDVVFDLSTEADLSLSEFSPLIPEHQPLSMDARLIGRISTRASLSQMTQLQLEKMDLSGAFTATDMHFRYDSLWFRTKQSDLSFAMPNPYAAGTKAAFLFAELKAGQLETGDKDMYAVIDQGHIMLETSDVREQEGVPVVLCSFKLDAFRFSLDTVELAVSMPTGSASVMPSYHSHEHPEFLLAFNSDRLDLALGAERVELDRVHLDLDVVNDKDQEDFFLQWLANGFIHIDDGCIKTSKLLYPIEIPSIKLEFDPEVFTIQESSIVLDNSDFQLRGRLNNVLSYFRGDSILQGEFNFVSNTTDIMQLMELTSGLGSEKDTDTTSDSTADQAVSEETQKEASYAGPYMVPLGIDLLLTTSIRNAVFGPDTANHIRGDVRLSDGILVLDDLSFVTPAARMQLTAMYRTPRKNHLFLGLDYHMLDIEIERLLQMIPEIDTIMPMLRSFKGQGNFHLAIESYLDSTYTLKMSTLRGAASITGTDLVLMDGETFTEIARTLRFSKRAENRVDSLSAEFTIFREEIDVYPFLIVMDRYSAVVGGRHNLDMSFNYHISVVESPLPVRLGIDITGNMDRLNYSLARPRYAEFYRPASRGVVQHRQQELRLLIREALLQRLQE